MRSATRNWRSCQRGCRRSQGRCGSLRYGARDWLWCPGGELTRLEALEVSSINMSQTPCSSRCRRASGS
jgi:hypothetical protein